MPIHDWTRVDAGLFHAFYLRWIAALSDALNAGGLPPGYFALPEQNVRGSIPDVLTLKLAPGGGEPDEDAGGLAVATVAPKVRLVRQTEAGRYARKASHVTVRHRYGD